MKWIEKLERIFPTPRLTNRRIFAALVVAIVADAVQFFLLPVAWTFAQSAVDVVAMVIVMALIGFHILLLPTFAIEIVPVVDAFPTWTACVVAVIALHRKLPPPAR